MQWRLGPAAQDLERRRWKQNGETLPAVVGLAAALNRASQKDAATAHRSGPLLNSWLMATLLPVGSTLMLYALSLWIQSIQMPPMIGKALIPDLLWQLLFAYALAWACASIRVFLAIQTLLFATVYWTQAWKVSALGGPIVPHDLGSAKFLLVIFWQAFPVMTVLTSLALLGLLVYIIRTTPLSPRLLRYLAPILVVVAPVACAHLAPKQTVNALEGVYGPRTAWNLTPTLRRRGATVFFLGELAEVWSSRSEPPARQQVESAFRQLRESRQPRLPGSTSTDDRGAEVNQEATDAAHDHRRNVYLFVVEALWDPAQLAEVRSAFHPEFEALLRASEHSMTVSPVEGGGTAEAEFELLCGSPSKLHPAIEFLRPRLDRLPCLPRELKRLGYQTLAFHPNVPSFWNRDNAYRDIGFDRFHSLSSFTLDDTDGAWLADHSFYRQADRLLAQSSDLRPTFSYLLSVALHWPFPRNEESRPDALELAPEISAAARRYSNAVYYDTLALAKAIASVRVRDPNGLLVAVGDHLPHLPALSQLFPEDRPSRTAAQELQRTSTPLLIIDGRRGPLSVGDVPMHAIPGLVLQLLGLDTQSSLSLISPPPPDLVSWHPTTPIVRDETEQVVRCSPAPMRASCRQALAWGEAVDTLTADLLSGQGYTRDLWAKRTPRRPTDQ